MRAPHGWIRVAAGETRKGEGGGGFYAYIIFSHKSAKEAKEARFCVIGRNGVPRLDTASLDETCCSSLSAPKGGHRTCYAFIDAKPGWTRYALGMVDNKWMRLQSMIREYGSCLVAYSGGVDSVFLAKVCHDLLGDRALAVIADSPSLPRSELEQARDIAERFGFAVSVIRTREFSNPEYVSNPLNRCYFCKHALFEELLPLAKNGGFHVIAYGENASDIGDFRPGAQAAAEFEVRAPLKEVGLTKEEVRELSIRLGLPTADKPQMACLSSRLPTGEPVTPEKLAMVESAEAFLRTLDFRDIRVRHHEMKQGHLARIEVGPEERSRLMDLSMMDAVARELQGLGYRHVTVDLQGYRRGSTNGKSLNS